MPRQRLTTFRRGGLALNICVAISVLQVSAKAGSDSTLQPRLQGLLAAFPRLNGHHLEMSCHVLVVIKCEQRANVVGLKGVLVEDSWLSQAGRLGCRLRLPVYICAASHLPFFLAAECAESASSYSSLNERPPSGHSLWSTPSPSASWIANAATSCGYLIPHHSQSCFSCLSASLSLVSLYFSVSLSLGLTHSLAFSLTFSLHLSSSLRFIRSLKTLI